MEEEKVKEIVEVLNTIGREDLGELLKSYFDDLKDKDYKPPVRVKEPPEEYDSDTGEEELFNIDCSPDGFFFLKG